MRPSPEKKKTSASERWRDNCANWTRSCGIFLPRIFLRKAIEGYLESKREQRL